MLNFAVFDKIVSKCDQCNAGYHAHCNIGLNQFIKGDNSPSINNGHITSWLYPVPPLAEQSRIVVEIEHWFSLIDIIKKGKANLQNTIQQAKSKIFDLAVHGHLVPQNPEDEPASELLKRINPKAEITCDNAHYPQLPISWCMVQLQDLCSLYDGEKVTIHDNLLVTHNKNPWIYQ